MFKIARERKKRKGEDEGDDKAFRKVRERERKIGERGRSEKGRRRAGNKYAEDRKPWVSAAAASV